MLDSPHACCTPLLLQACSGCSMGTGFAQQHSSTHLSVEQSTAVPGCPGTLRMLYVGARSCCTPRKATASAAACAHLFVTATEF
jgi:hypothetical protein